MQDDVQPDVWSAELEEALVRVGPRFGRGCRDLGADDPDPCRAAKVPDRVTAHSAYGQEWRFRRMPANAGVGYVLAAPESWYVHGLRRLPKGGIPRVPHRSRRSPAGR